MRIFTAIRHSNDARCFYGGLWSANFYPALRELGHEIVESRTDLHASSRFMSVANNFTREELEVRTRTSERILDEVRAAYRRGRIDLFLSYFYNSHFDPSAYDELRALGIPSVNFYCNSTYQLQYVTAVSAKADFAWHTERDARSSYLAIGANPVWVQMGADPSLCRPIDSVFRENTACFVGQRYADRDRLLAALLRAHVPLALYGSGWGKETPAGKTAPRTSSNTATYVYLGRAYHAPGSLRSYWGAAKESFQQQGLVAGACRILRQWQYRAESRRLGSGFRDVARGPVDDVAETFARHALVLNFSNVWSDGRPGSRLIPHVRLRDFEAPMSRACYLTAHTDEINEFYEVGREIDAYKSPEELVDKARFYLNNPVSAEMLRNAGYIRATRDHTWVRRFEQLFKKVGLTH